jgi:tetratricopeptide (TPR) repeat protein
VTSHALAHITSPPPLPSPLSYSLALRPRAKPVALALAELCLRGKLYSDAAGYVQRVLAWDPACPTSKGLLRSIWLGQGMTYTQANDIYGAIGAYHRALEVIPEAGGSGPVEDRAGAAVQRAEVGFLLGGLYEGVGNMDQALTWYRFVSVPVCCVCAHACV